jgi:hypothetical protein
MAQMSFRIQGVGISKLSLGEAWLGFKIGPGIVYHWVGTGTSSALANAWSKPFDVPDDSILFGFEGEDVNMKVTGGIYGWGRTNIKLAINAADNSLLLYDIAPKGSDHALGVNIVGMIPTDFELAAAQFHLIHDPKLVSFHMALMGFSPDGTDTSTPVDTPTDTGAPVGNPTATA